MKIDLNFGRNFSRLNVDTVVVICHGLPYEAGSALDKSYDSIAEFFSKRGIPAIAFDFSGTGKSKGEFSLLSWLEDLENIASNFEEVHVVGFSMGGVVAYNLENAGSYSIISSPFSFEIFDEFSLKAIYSNAILKGTLKGIRDYETFKRTFVDEFQTIAPLNAKPKRDVIVIHGVRDEIVPFSHGERLFRHSRKPKKFVKVENGDHFLRKNIKVIEIVHQWIGGKREGESQVSIRI